MRLYLKARLFQSQSKILFTFPEWSSFLVLYSLYNEVGETDILGHPKPHIVWRREDSEDIMVDGKKGRKTYFEDINSKEL